MVTIASHGIGSLLIGQKENQVRFTHRVESSGYVKNKKEEKQTSFATHQKLWHGLGAAAKEPKRQRTGLLEVEQMSMLAACQRNRRLGCARRAAGLELFERSGL